MRIIKLPRNCSAYYMHEISPFDDIKKETTALIQKEFAMPMIVRRISAIFATTLKTNKKLVESFKTAGFRIVASYRSNNHNQREVLMFFRPVTFNEMMTGVPRWKIYKARKSSLKVSRR